MESNLELQKDNGTSLIHFVQLHVQTGQQTPTGREYGVAYLKYPVMSGIPNIFGLSELLGVPEISLL